MADHMVGALFVSWRAGVIPGGDGVLTSDLSIQPCGGQLADAAHGQRSAAISKAIIALAHGLGLRAIAEGVETAQQHEFFRGIGCDLFQGFFFSRPVSAEQITALLRSRSGG